MSSPLWAQKAIPLFFKAVERQIRSCFKKDGIESNFPGWCASLRIRYYATTVLTATVQIKQDREAARPAKTESSCKITRLTATHRYIPASAYQAPRRLQFYHRLHQPFPHSCALVKLVSNPWQGFREQHDHSLTTSYPPLHFPGWLQHCCTSQGGRNTTRPPSSFFQLLFEQKPSFKTTLLQILNQKRHHRTFTITLHDFPKRGPGKHCGRTTKN